MSAALNYAKGRGVKLYSIGTYMRVYNLLRQKMYQIGTKMHFKNPIAFVLKLQSS